MTAREFLEWAGYEVNEENLYALTRYAGDLTNIDFSQFPDAAIPDEILEDAEMEANFQDWMDGRTLIYFLGGNSNDRKTI